MIRSDFLVEVVVVLRAIGGGGCGCGCGFLGLLLVVVELGLPLVVVELGLKSRKEKGRR